MWSSSALERVAKHLQGQPQSMDSMIAVYDETLKLYQSVRPPNSSWPIICINEANVLTQWQQGNLKKKETLRFLLRYFVKVGRDETSLAATKVPFL